MKTLPMNKITFIYYYNMYNKEARLLTILGGTFLTEMRLVLFHKINF